MRQRDGYLKPDSMKEDAFAIVLVGDKCQVRRARVLDPLVESTSGADASTSCAQVAGCVSTKKVSTLWAFRARLCKSCIDTLCVIFADTLLPPCGADPALPPAPQPCLARRRQEDRGLAQEDAELHAVRPLRGYVPRRSSRRATPR